MYSEGEEHVYQSLSFLGRFLNFMIRDRPKDLSLKFYKIWETISLPNGLGVVFTMLFKVNDR